jgi:hypothetical protein
LLIGSESKRKGSSRPSSVSSRSVDSDFSVWSDTGDLAEQLANEEDPLQIRLRKSLDDDLFRRGRPHSAGKKPKRAHYPEDVASRHSAVDKEAIEIPSPPPRQISGVERILAAIMSPNNRGNGQVHGLVGKPLLYVLQLD